MPGFDTHSDKVRERAQALVRELQACERNAQKRIAAIADEYLTDLPKAVGSKSPFFPRNS
ncbi:MAG TPA: hypothetical protein VGG37_04655 [Opitutaceae bacterium]|jgi:hypothetical protein